MSQLVSKPRSYKLEVEQVEEFANQIYRILTVSEQPIAYLPGQYVEFETELGMSPISIANKPSRSGRVEFHVRRIQGASLNDALFRCFNEKHVMCQAPLGACHIERLSGCDELVLLVAGTGFAPAKALLETLLATGKKIHLYWLSRDRDDFYLQDIIHAWGRQYANFHYHLTVWSRSESMQELFLKWQPVISSLTAAKVYMAGPFDMMFKLREELLALGFAKNQLLSDAFDMMDGN